MKTEMRRALAREPFEPKIHKTEQLLQLSQKLKAQRAVRNVDFAARGLRAYNDATRKVLALEELGGIRLSFPRFGGNQSWNLVTTESYERLNLKRTGLVRRAAKSFAPPNDQPARARSARE